MQEQVTGALGLTASQAARALGVSIGTIRRWSDLGHLGTYRTPGGQRRFTEAHIREFIDALQRDAEAAQAARTAASLESETGDEAIEGEAGTHAGEIASAGAGTPPARARATVAIATAGARR